MGNHTVGGLPTQRTPRSVPDGPDSQTLLARACCSHMSTEVRLLGSRWRRMGRRCSCARFFARHAPPRPTPTRLARCRRCCPRRMRARLPRCCCIRRPGACPSYPPHPHRAPPPPPCRPQRQQRGRPAMQKCGQTTRARCRTRAVRYRALLATAVAAPVIHQPGHSFSPRTQLSLTVTVGGGFCGCWAAGQRYRSCRRARHDRG